MHAPIPPVTATLTRYPSPAVPLPSEAPVTQRRLDSTLRQYRGRWAVGIQWGYFFGGAQMPHRRLRDPHEMAGWLPGL